MPFSLSDLNKKTRTVTVEYLGESAQVVYRPNNMTLRAQIVAGSLTMMARGGELGGQTIGEATAAFSDLASSLVDLIVSWDILSEDGDPLPVTRDTVKALPLNLTVAIFSAIMNDTAPNPKAGES
jgi:hypothetical protein